MSAPRDAEMNSSPTSSMGAEDEAEQDLFPESETNTNTDPTLLNPQNHLNAIAPGELSPPRSQGSEEPDVLPTSEVNGNGNGHAMEYREEEGRQTQTQGPAKPGSGWNNKRANEEMQRAWEAMLDKDFNLREFGDVMATEEQQQPQGQRG